MSNATCKKESKASYAVGHIVQGPGMLTHLHKFHPSLESLPQRSGLVQSAGTPEVDPVQVFSKVCLAHFDLFLEDLFAHFVWKSIPALAMEHLHQLRIGVNHHLEELKHHVLGTVVLRELSKGGEHLLSNLVSLELRSAWH